MVVFVAQLPNGTTCQFSEVLTWNRTETTAPQISSPTINCSPNIARMRFSQHRDAKPFRRRIIHLPPFLLASSQKEGQEIDLFSSSYFFCFPQDSQATDVADIDWVGQGTEWRYFQAKAFHFSPIQAETDVYCFEYKVFETMTLSIPKFYALKT